MGTEGSRTYPVKVESIEGLMEKHNISRAELARRSGLSYKQVCNILEKRTRQLREDTITRIAAALGAIWKTLLEEFDGSPQQASASGGIAVQTTTQIILDLRGGITIEEARKRLNKKLSDRHLNASDIISITLLRDGDET